MKYNHIIIAILIGLVSFSSFGQTINETVKGNNKFAFEIFKEVFKKDGNVFISPYSISSALAMTYAGARNETEKQMRAFGLTDADIKKETQDQMDIFKTGIGATTKCSFETGFLSKLLTDWSSGKPGADYIYEKSNNCIITMAQ